MSADANGWMPIESAPRDGFPILLAAAYQQHNYAPDKAWWSAKHKAWVIALTDAGRPIVATLPYTHWQELPLSPAVSA